jgi:hypothetical protein
MERPRFFRHDPLRAILFGSVFGTTFGLWTWWGSPSFTHVTWWAIVVGVAFGPLGARLSYARGIEAREALLIVTGLAVGALLVFG